MSDFVSSANWFIFQLPAHFPIVITKYSGLTMCLLPIGIYFRGLVLNRVRAAGTKLVQSRSSQRVFSRLHTASILRILIAAWFIFVGLASIALSLDEQSSAVYWTRPWFSFPIITLLISGVWLGVIGSIFLLHPKFLEAQIQAKSFVYRVGVSSSVVFGLYLLALTPFGFVPF